MSTHAARTFHPLSQGPQGPQGPLIFEGKLAQAKFLESCVYFRNDTLLKLLCDNDYHCTRVALFPYRGSNGMSVFSLSCDSFTKGAWEVHTLNIAPRSPIKWGWVRRWVQSKRTARIATLLNCCRTHSRKLPEPDLGRVIACYVSE